MNTKDKSSTKQVGQLLKEISAPARIKILLAIGNQEACVCHLEAVLGMRQAYLSQHLMALRHAGILVTHRDGRYIYYRLAEPRILDVIKATAATLGVMLDEHQTTPSGKKCPCPKCQGLD